MCIVEVPKTDLLVCSYCGTCSLANSEIWCGYIEADALCFKLCNVTLCRHEDWKHCVSEIDFRPSTWDVSFYWMFVYIFLLSLNPSPVEQ